MRKLFKELFYIPKYGKIPEKAMLLRVSLMAVTVIGCLAAMGFTAFAYFSHDISSGSNVIQAARFEAIVSIQYTNGGEIVTVEPDSNNAYALYADQEYTVVLKPTEDSTAQTGFVIIAADHSDTRYHTQQLYIGDPQNASPIVFTVTVAEDTLVRFSSNWGTSSQYAAYQENGDPGEYYIVDREENVNLKFQATTPPTIGVTLPETETTQPTNPTEETEPVQPSYQLNYTDITANVGWATTLQLLDAVTGTPVTGITWYVSEPDYISLEMQEDGVKVIGTAGTVGVPGVSYGRVWCEYEGVTYTCIFRIKDPNKTETTTS